jgi:hypothetical protein
MNSKLSQDLAFGLNNEKLLKNRIQQITGTLKHTPVYHSFDYYNNTCFVELKSRNCNFDKYDTTMIGMNKIKKCIEPTKDYYFFFSFADNQLLYWKYITTDFEIKQGGRFDRGKPELNDYLYIPIKELIPVQILTSCDLLV